LAQIAAVQLRIPDLPGFLARAELEAEDRPIKAEPSGHVSGRLGPGQAPAHRRAAHAGWFAPTG
jgi:hypothetical protein